MLSVGQDAPADEIKKALRREVARYHPDKVQHLGPEFQDMAAGIAADLTEAYRILMDPALRAKDDHEMRDGSRAPCECRAGGRSGPSAPEPGSAAASVGAAASASRCRPAAADAVATAA